MPSRPRSPMTGESTRSKPPWLRRRLPIDPGYERLCSLIREQGLTTVCREAPCPNQFECFARGTATFLILGDRCSRACRFCAVGHGPEAPPDPEEPRRVAETVRMMGLSYCVITSVSRDDLTDGGAAHFAAVIRTIRHHNPHTLIEVLIPDFLGDPDALATVLAARPDVLNHNLETVARLYPAIRPGADYRRSLELLARSKTLAPGMATKSGIMLGLGETGAELSRLFLDLRDTCCDILTIGQYLQPSPDHAVVDRFVPPEEFDALRQKAERLGFGAVAAAPFVRSSYRAEALFRHIRTATPGGPEASPPSR